MLVWYYFVSRDSWQAAAIMGISDGSAKVIVYDNLVHCKFCENWLPRQASIADMASWATQKLLFRRNEKAPWTILEMHHHAWEQKITHLFSINGNNGIVQKLTLLFYIHFCHTFKIDDTFWTNILSHRRVWKS